MVDKEGLKLTEATYYDRSASKPLTPLTWEAIDSAVRRLDGAQYTAVFVRNGAVWLSASGGNEGFYMVTGGAPSGEAVTLVDPKGKRRGSRTLVCAGVSAPYRLNQCVRLEPALHTLKRFAVEGEFDSGEMMWE